MKWLDEWRQRRDDAWWEKWREEHRWDELADYNSRVSKGIVHTPEYVAYMAEKQIQFDRAMRRQDQ